MLRRSFLIALNGLLGVARARAMESGEEEQVRYLTPGRHHALLASDVADAVTFRRPPGQPDLIVDFERYNADGDILRSLRLRVSETSAGVYVRGPEAFSVRLMQDKNASSLSLTVTSVAFAQRSRVSVFTEKAPEWPDWSCQVIVVATPTRSGRDDRRVGVVG
jgi:hypothetical protein